MEGKQTIERNGRASVSVLVSIAQLKESFETITEDIERKMGSTSKGEVTVSGFDCASADYQTSILENATCIERGEDTVLLSGTTQLKKPAFTVRKAGAKNIYTYRMSDVLRILSDPDNPTTIESLKENTLPAPMKLTYTILMPEKITRADIGKVKGKAVTFDLMDLTKEPKAIVQSKEPTQKHQKGKQK